jgi:hypothetical protein
MDAEKIAEAIHITNTNRILSTKKSLDIISLQRPFGHTKLKVINRYGLKKQKKSSKTAALPPVWFQGTQDNRVMNKGQEETGRSQR